MGYQRIPRFEPQPLRRAPPKPRKERSPFVMPKAVTSPFATLSAALGRTWTAAPKLSDVLDPERNSFGVMRLMMALAVLVSHAFFLRSGSFSAEPLVALTNYSLGQYGVQGFFILSGVVVTQSLMKRHDLADYARARALRIFPALIVCVLACALALGPVFSLFGAENYFASPSVFRYIAATLSLSTGSALLPGVFAFNPAPGLINQSLWTLKYEVACYLLLGVIATIVWRSKARRHIVGGLTAVWALAMLALKPNLLHEGNFLDTFAYFTLFFGTGVAAYLLRDVIRLCWLPLAALGAAFFATIGSDTAEIMSALFLGYGLLWLSTFKFGGLRAYIGQNDYSYGTYIYGYPASQAILALSPDVNILSLIAATLAVTLVLAFMSWELIERPALSMVRSLRSRQQLVPRKRLTPTAVPVSNNAMARLAVGQQAETQPSPPSATSLSDALARRPSRPPTLVPTEPEKAFDDSRLRARLAKISRGQHGLELQ